MRDAIRCGLEMCSIEDGGHGVLCLMKHPMDAAPPFAVHSTCQRNAPASYQTWPVAQDGATVTLTPQPGSKSLPHSVVALKHCLLSSSSSSNRPRLTVRVPAVVREAYA